MKKEEIIIKRKGRQISVEIRGWNFIGICNRALTSNEIRGNYLIENFLMDFSGWKKSDKFVLNRLTNPVTLSIN